MVGRISLVGMSDLPDVQRHVKRATRGTRQSTVLYTRLALPLFRTEIVAFHHDLCSAKKYKAFREELKRFHVKPKQFYRETETFPEPK